MFISRKIAFLELHKTGCSQIRAILDDLLDGTFAGEHNQAGPELFTGDRVFLGSVRNPWEWYISLWAYGCDRRGQLFQTVTRRNIIRSSSEPEHGHETGAEFLRSVAIISGHPQKWRRTYENVDDAGAFRVWLHMMQDASYLPDIGEGYSESPVSRIAGFMTFRYLKLFCTRAGEERNLDDLSSFEKIRRYDDSRCFIDHFIRNERLEADLFRILEACGSKVPDEAKSRTRSRSRRNASSRKFGPQYYYDPVSEQLVGKRERLIIEKFGYRPPGPAVAGGLSGIPGALS